MLEADAVVAGLGIEPSVELAADAGLPVDGRHRRRRPRPGRRSASDVFAAGDVARFPVAALGGTMRVEHEDHAKSHGRRVGANMAGADEPYDHLPFFYSDLFDLGYEAVGELDSRLRTTADWTEPAARAPSTTWTARGGREESCSGTSSGSVDTARDLIRAAMPIQTAELVG